MEDRLILLGKLAVRRPIGQHRRAPRGRSRLVIEKLAVFWVGRGAAFHGELPITVVQGIGERDAGRVEAFAAVGIESCPADDGQRQGGIEGFDPHLGPGPRGCK
jgi:hypothetical protein